LAQECGLDNMTPEEAYTRLAAYWAKFPLADEEQHEQGN
jgi:hypothetical protein